jgi:Peptidase A4 family
LVNRKLGSLLSVFAATVFVTISITAASASSAAATHRVASSQSAAVTAHQVNACGLHLTVYTPKAAGAAMPGSALGMPSGKNSLLGLAASQHFQWLSTISCQSVPTSPPPPEQPGNLAAYDTYNWSGYVDPTSKPNYAQAYWRVPTVCCKTGKAQYSSTWVGIGNGLASGTDLIQDGTEQDVSATGKTRYYFWVETFPKPQQRITNLTAGRDQLVAVSTAYGTHIKGKATFVLCNVSKKKCVGVSESAKHPDNYAEWIVERTAYCTSAKNGHYEYPELSKSSIAHFTSGYFDLSSKKKVEHKISQGHPIKTYMLSPGSKPETISSPGPLISGGTAFEVTWHGHGTPREIKPVAKC